MGARPHIPWTPKRWPWLKQPTELQMHSGFPALPRGSGAEVSSRPRCCLIGWQHPSGRASGSRRRGVQRRAERSSGPSSWNPLPGVRHGVRFPQVHRQSGTGPGTGKWWTPEPPSPFHHCVPAPRRRGAARVLLIPCSFFPPAFGFREVLERPRQTASRVEPAAQISFQGEKPGKAYIASLSAYRPAAHCFTWKESQWAMPRPSRSQ